MFPILFSIGAVHIFSLSVFIVLAWGVWSFLFWKALRHEGIEEDPMFDLMFYGTIMTLIVSRIGFIVTHRDLFADTVLKMFALWVQPGLSLYAGLFGGMVTIWWLSKKKKVRLGVLLDALAFSLPAAMFIGKLGSLLDGAEVGKFANVPWAVRYVGHTDPRHPIQMYEMIGLGVLLFILSYLQKRASKEKWPYGMFGVWFFLLYAPVMFALEFLKESRVYWSLTINQWVLLGIWAESLGVYYVRGGGRELVRMRVKGAYTAIIKRRHTKSS